jgi:hypothetical protein
MEGRPSRSGSAPPAAPAGPRGTGRLLGSRPRPRVSFFLRLFLVALVPFLGACVSLPMPRTLTPDTPRAGTGWKHVAEKRDPVYLVAVDGTECTVSRGRFERVERGDRVLCSWH